MKLIKFDKILFKFWLMLNPIKSPKTIFIIGHMRSGSSLLEHILSTNNEILGVGEQNRKYVNSNSIKKMELFSRWKQRRFFTKYTYCVDQVLHNEMTPNFSLFNTITFIFLIRAPKETIASIENLKSNHFGIKRTDKIDAFEYYLNRINYLKTISENIPKKNMFFLTYNDLINDSTNSLKSLTKFLRLKKPLTKHYLKKNTTGKFGDTSDNIKEGRIIHPKIKYVDLNKEKLKISEIEFKKTKNYFYKL